MVYTPAYQRFEASNIAIRDAFQAWKRTQNVKEVQRLSLAWSNWGFGTETLAVSAKRLQQAGVGYIELHGNHYGADLGYHAEEVRTILADHGLQVSGVCGMFSVDQDLSSHRPHIRQAALDYLKREIPFTQAVGGSYLLVVPAAVGRSQAYDAMEFHRSTEALRTVADLFEQHHVRGAIEPIRADETSIVHSVADAMQYIAAVNHPGVRHINGDVYHMQLSEDHIGDAILQAGDRLINLHMADSHRGALGTGALDVDTIIRALYVIGYNTAGKYVTFEPLGSGSDPYRAMNYAADPVMLDELVMRSISYFRQREEQVLREE